MARSGTSDGQYIRKSAFCMRVVTEFHRPGLVEGNRSDATKIT